MQNVSHAVMAQRTEARDSLDDFPTPPWATRALVEHAIGRPAALRALTCLEPACGVGHMAKVLAEYFGEVRSSDIHAYGFGKIEEPQYVSGVVAAWMAPEGSLGYVGAFPIPEVIRGINAFTLGAQTVNPDVTVQVVWTNTWFDPQLESQAAQSLIDLGVEVIATNQDSAAVQQAPHKNQSGLDGIGRSLTVFRTQAEERRVASIGPAGPELRA